MLYVIYKKTQKLSGQPFIVNFTFEMVGMEWGMDHGWAQNTKTGVKM